jgi:hypothetical protein
MYIRLAALILSVLLPLALRAQTTSVLPDPHHAQSGVVVAGIEAGQGNIQREQQMQDRRGQREFERRKQLELMERQRELDRQQRKIEQQRRQLLQLQAESDAQRAAIHPSQSASTRGTPEAR